MDSKRFTSSFFRPKDFYQERLQINLEKSKTQLSMSLNRAQSAPMNALFKASTLLGFGRSTKSVNQRQMNEKVASDNDDDDDDDFATKNKQTKYETKSTVRGGKLLNNRPQTTNNVTRKK